MPTLPDGGRAGKADTALTVGAASGTSALGYAPSNRSLYKVSQPNADAAGRRPRRQSRHGLDGRRRKRRLSSWLRPIKPFSLQSGASGMPTLPDGGRAGKADTALTVGAASGASALGYAPQGESLSAPGIREEIRKGDQREDYDRDDRHELEDEREDDHENRE